MNQEFGNSMRDRFGYRKFVWLLVLASGVFLLSIGTGISPAFGSIGNDRVALLIGNADYSGKDKLENPVNDVNDYGKALRQAGFTVEIKTNLGRSELFDAIQGFSKRVKNINGIALLHYAGHGFKADDTNFIVPIGAKTDDGKEKLANESVPAEAMVKLLGDSPTRVNVVILDMCRNIPSRGIRGNDGGLASMKPVTGTLMAFSTQSGKTAQDGAGQRNSPYARNLIAALSQTDLTVTDYFAEVRALVRKETNNEQEPREDSALVGRAPTLLVGGPEDHKDEKKFFELSRKLAAGDMTVQSELEKQPMYQALARQMKLNKEQVTDQPSSAENVGGGGDQQAIAMTIAQSQSEDQDERKLAEAMAVYLRHAPKELIALAEQGNSFAAMMTERSYKRGVSSWAKDADKAKKWHEAAQKSNIPLDRLAGKNNLIALCWLANRYRDSETPEDQRKAVQIFEQVANSGYSYAMSALANMYSSGRGVAKDDAQAMEWTRKAANAGVPNAMIQLGYMYAKGRGGLSKDDMKAVEWYRKAADIGDGNGMAYLGDMYREGRGVTKDDAEAVKWYRRAVDAGESNAMQKLGYMYVEGRGVTKDNAKAVEWYRKAADTGNPSGMNDLGAMYQKGRGGLTQDDTKAVEWYRKAAEAGNDWGMNNLGFMYQEGRGGLTRNDAKAVEWYRKAAEGGYDVGMNNLAYMYQTGRGGLAKDDTKAEEWYRKAAESGNILAMRNLGYIYRDGSGSLTKDDSKAVELFRKAAEAGDANAMNNMAYMYQTGRGGLTKDDTKAGGWYRKGAEAGDADAMNNLALMYQTGSGGLTKDDTKAVEWYRKAAEAGNANAKDQLEAMNREGRGASKDDKKAVDHFITVPVTVNMSSSSQTYKFDKPTNKWIPE